jgi:putative PIN family toxin of toxin-antitoxin system
MTPSAVYDTNVVVSAALYADSLPASLVSFAIAGEVRLFLSPPILEEYTEVLKRPKFQFDTRKVNRLLRDITHAAIMVTPERRISASPDESDNRFLECAHASGADYLVTGNKRHFPFPAYEGTAIVSPAEFTQIVIA